MPPVLTCLRSSKAPATKRSGASEAGKEPDVTARQKHFAYFAFFAWLFLVLLLPGIVLFAVGFTLQAGATGAVRAIKMSTALLAARPQRLDGDAARLDGSSEGCSSAR